MPYRRGLRIEIILARQETPFSMRVNEAVLRASALLDRSVIVERSFVDESRPVEVAKRLLASNADALVVYGQEHVEIIDAVTTLTSNGVPVVTMVSDLPTSPRLAYVGIDHYGAGRTAAYFMARMAPQGGPVLVLCHSFDYRAHAERVSGFRDGLADHGSDLAILNVLQGRDHLNDSETLLLEAIRRSPQAIAGIYNTGGANRAVERALVQSGNTPPAIFIGHELTANTGRMLADGVMTLAIDQNPEEQARRAVDIVLHRFGYTSSVPDAGPVPFTIFSPENTPPVAPD
jgi:LacI family transcriptional regulator